MKTPWTGRLLPQAESAALASLIRLLSNAELKRHTFPGTEKLTAVRAHQAGLRSTQPSAQPDGAGEEPQGGGDSCQWGPRASVKLTSPSSSSITPINPAGPQNPSLKAHLWAEFCHSKWAQKQEGPPLHPHPEARPLRPGQRKVGSSLTSSGSRRTLILLMFQRECRPPPGGGGSKGGWPRAQVLRLAVT